MVLRAFEPLPDKGGTAAGGDGPAGADCRAPINAPLPKPFRWFSFRIAAAAAASALITTGTLHPLSSQARIGLGGGPGFGGLGSGVGGYRFGAGVGVGRWGADVHPVYGPAVRPAFEARPAAADFYGRPYLGWHPAWRAGGYWAARPWNAGWYRVAPASWDWWNAGASAWGITGLATAASITGLVNAAADLQQPVFVVPESSFQLNYASVEPVGAYGASFTYSLGAGPSLFGGVNCQAGLLNGQVPTTAAEAQLVSAVCQVAYGPAL